MSHIGHSKSLAGLVRKHPKGVVLTCHVQPGSSQETVILWQGKLKVKVAPKPVDDGANRRLCELVAELLKVPRSSVQLLHGRRSREKQIVIVGLDVGECEKRLAAIIHT